MRERREISLAEVVRLRNSSKVDVDFEVGRRYKVREYKGDKRKPALNEEGELVDLNKRIATFTNGKYRFSESLKDYKIGREAKEIRK